MHDTTTRILCGALASVAAIALAGCRAEGSTEPRTPYPYDIVLERREGSNLAPDIYYLDLESGNATRILASNLAGMHPSAYPGGSQVVFVRNDNEFTNEIFAVTRAADGTFGNLTNLTNHPQVDVMPAWSPNGQRIAFVTDRMGFQDIFVMNANGTNVRRITLEDPPGVVTTEWWPAWSPDGTRIAYSSTLEGTADIWITTVDATPVIREHRTAGADVDLHPTWSPDGRQLAFQRTDANTGEADIVILTLSTGELRVIDMPGQQLWPAWSPAADEANHRIAFSSDHEDADLEIYTMRPDGTNVVRRTTNGVNDLRPAWIIRPVTP